MSHRPEPPPRRLRRPALSAAILIAALVAVGGAACSSASAPPSAIPRTVLVGPSGTIPTPEMATLRTVAERVRVPPTSSAPPVDAAEPASPPRDEVDSPDGTGESSAPPWDAARSVTGTPAGPADPLVIARGTWACSYLAVGAASGSTLELRVDDLGGHITPEPGDVVELSCLDGSTLVHQEILVFDPDRPLGSLDELPRSSDP